MDHYFTLGFGDKETIDAEGKTVVIEELLVTCDSVGAYIVVSDGESHRTLYVKQGFGDPFKWSMGFAERKDIVFTAHGGKMSVFVRYNRK